MAESEPDVRKAEAGSLEAQSAVMDRDDVDRALARLGAEHEAVETSLLALQDHAGRRLLEGPG